MGSTFQYVTLEKAMEALQVSKRTIYRYISRNHLRTAKQGEKLLVSRKDVDSLVELRAGGPKTRPVNKDTVNQLEARVHQLEIEMRVVKRILDLHNESLNLSAEELLHIYTMAIYHLKEEWAPQSEDVWMDTFVRMRVEDIEKLATVVEDEDPWRPFHQLARCMIDQPHNIDMKLQLSAGKNNLERIAYIWIRRDEKNAKDLDRIINKDGKDVRKMIRKIKTRRSKK